MKILFVDHECHLKTRSADFLLELLRREHEVTCHYYARPYDCRLTREEIAAADVIVFWEFLPGRFRLGVPGKRCVFVPMYDNEWGSAWQWRRIAASRMTVISFSKAVSDHARVCGVKNLLDVRFAFDPAARQGRRGNPRRALYWDRGDFPEERIRALFAPGAIDELVVQRDFLPAERYAAFVEGFGVYIAPRAKEGIGMSFLEQQARGACIVAHDAPTMNEALDNGMGGILRDFNDSAPTPITREEIDRVLRTVPYVAAVRYQVWQEHARVILELFSAVGKVPKMRHHGPRSLFRYLMMCCEYVVLRCGLRICGALPDPGSRGLTQRRRDGEDRSSAGHCAAATLR